jgi:hypothetical protein
MIGGERQRVSPLRWGCARLRELLEGVRMICTPMAAAGRYVGVVLSERKAGAREMDEDDRQLL